MKQIDLTKTYVVIDLETSGIDVSNRITEIAALKIVGGKIKDGFYTETCDSPQETKNGMFIAEALKKLIEFSKGCTVVGHYLPFYFGFLKHWGEFYGVDFDEFKKDALDTSLLMRQILGRNVESRRLETLADWLGVKFINLETKNYVRTTAETFLKLAAFETESEHIAFSDRLL